MPLHRKATHRPKIVAAALGVGLTVSGAAVAAQLDHEPVRSAPQPLLKATGTPSSGPSSTSPDRLERDAHPSRSASAGRPALPGRTSGGQTAHRPTPTATPFPTPTPPPLPTAAAKATVRASRASSAPASPSGRPSSRPSRRSGTTGGSAPTPSASPVTTVLDATNTARRKAGLPALAMSACLADLAQRHAERLAAAHTLYHQDLTTVMGSCGLSAAGENVAMNYSGPGGFVGQWLTSPPHRANLLSGRFTVIGVGVAQAPDGSWYGVQVFGAN